MKSNKEVRFFVSFKAALAPFKPLPILLSGGSIFCCHQPTRKGLFFVWFSLSVFPARGFSIFFIYLFLLWYETLFISHVKEYSWINMFYTFWHNLSNQGIRVSSYTTVLKFAKINTNSKGLEYHFPIHSLENEINFLIWFSFAKLLSTLYVLGSTF